MKTAVLKSSLFAFFLAAGAAHAADCPPGADAPAMPQAAATQPTLAQQALYQQQWAELMRLRALLGNPFMPMNPHWMPVLFAPPPAPVMPAPISTLQATEQGFRLEVPLPGFKAEDIQVRVEGALLAIAARTSSATNTEGGEAQSRRGFAQTLTLPAQVEAAELKQRFENGVLILTLPVRKTPAGSV